MKEHLDMVEIFSATSSFENLILKNKNIIKTNLNLMVFIQEKLKLK